METIKAIMLFVIATAIYNYFYYYEYQEFGFIIGVFFTTLGIMVYKRCHKCKSCNVKTEKNPDTGYVFKKCNRCGVVKFVRIENTEK